MIKAKIIKVNKNQGSSPQVDIEVEFVDDASNFKWFRVVQRDLSSNNSVEATKEAVENEIRRIGNEYKRTLATEDELKKGLEGKEIII